MSHSFKIGTRFPDYELTGHDKKRYKLSEIQGIDPMILVLARGYYCPKDQWQHKRLVEFYPELNVGYAKIVTISTDNLLETLEFRESLNATWPFLSDAGRKIQKEFDIAEYTDPHHNPMIPHTLVLKPGLEIHKVYNGYWFFGRPTIEELRMDLRAIQQEIRPDWDLTKSDIKDAWDKEHRASFYPYKSEKVDLF